MPNIYNPALPSLPAYVHPVIVDKPKTSTTSRGAVNSTATKASERQLNMAAAGSVIPLIYGRDIGGALIGNVLYHNNYWVIQAIWCEGEIDAIESIHFDSKDLPNGVLVDNYLGTPSQNVNTHLVAAFNAKGITYADDLRGLAYSVIRVPQSVIDGMPNITAVIRGRKVYDPISGTKIYTGNPSLILADVLSDTLIGCGQIVDWDSVISAQLYNDELIQGEPRANIGISFRQKSTADSVIETLRTYASVWLAPGKNGTKFILDAPSPTVKSISHAAGDIIGVRSITKTPHYDAPSLVRIAYTNTSALPWTDAKVESTWDEGLPYSKQRIQDLQLPGFASASMAKRVSVERLNKFNLYDLKAQLDVFDGIELEIGDVIEVTHPIGFTNKQFRVTDITSAIEGYSLGIEEYSDAVYSDEVASDLILADVDLPDPNAPVSVTNLDVAEEVYLQQDHTYSSRLRVTWTPADFAFVSEYEILIKNGSELVYSGTANYGAVEWVSPAIQEGNSYTVQVRVISSSAKVSAPASKVITALGKMLVPGDVPAISAIEKNRVLYLIWLPAIDIDIWRYEIRYGAVGVSWDAATILDRVDGLSTSTNTLAIGTNDYLVKAIDSVGQYSNTAARVTHTIAAPGTPGSITAVYKSPSITLKWSAASLAKNYEIRYGAVGVSWSGAAVIDITDSLELVVNNLGEGSYDFLVRSIDLIGIYSLSEARVTRAVTAPPNVTGVAGFEVAGEVRLSWNPVSSGVKNYEIRYGAVGATWDSAKIVDRSDTLRLSTKSIPVGSWVFLVKAISHEGIYSGGAAKVPVAVTLDVNAFLVGEYEFDQPTVTGMAEYALGRIDENRYFITEDGGSMSAKFSGALLSYANPLASYNAVNAQWLSEVESFGVSLSGSWQAEVPVINISGSHTETLELSNDDGINWTGYPFSAKTTARAARVKINAVSGSTVLVTIPRASIRVDAIPREETGSIMTSPSGATLVQLSNDYTSAMSLSVTPIGSTPRTAVFDQLLLSPVTGLQIEGRTISGSASLDFNFGMSRSIQSGDHLEYDVYIVSQPSTSAAKSGGATIKINGLAESFSDAYGSNSSSESIPIGAWVNRKFDLSSFSGTLTNIGIGIRASDTAGGELGKVVYKNIRITNGSGMQRELVWSGYDPAWSGIDADAVNIIEAQGGLSNSFRIYVFDANNSQVANNVLWSFKGV